MTKYIEINRLKYLLDFAIKHIVKEGKFTLKVESDEILVESNIHKKTKMSFNINGHVLLITHDISRRDFDRLVAYLINQNNIIHWDEKDLYNGRAEGWFCDEKESEKYKADVNMLVNQVKLLQKWTAINEF